MADSMDAYVVGELVEIRDENSEAYKSLMIGTRQYAYPVRVSVKSDLAEGLVIGRETTVRVIVSLRETKAGKPWMNVYGVNVTQASAAAAA